jgi:hypothetical protein
MGITHNQGGELEFQTNEATSGGAAAGDYDGDGWVDFVCTRIDGPPILYRNEEGMGFTDVTVAAGMSEAQPTGSNGAAWGDIDNDGDLDLYLTAFRTSKQILAYRYFLYINNGDGTFTEEGNERRASLKSENPHYGQSVSFGDYDRDGYLDIHVTEWASPAQNPKNLPSHNRLLRNLGTANPGYFVDVTQQAGVSVDEVVGHLIIDEGDFGFTPRFSDLDGDGWPDLAIASDFTESVLFWSNGDGKFINGTEAAGVGLDKNGMGATTADFNGDGLLDWFVTAIWEEDVDELPGNFLYMNNGDRTFVSRAVAFGVEHGFWGWGTTALDYDNDGDQDIVEVNGYYDEDHALFRHFSRNPMRFWRNGISGFIELSNSVGLTDDHSGRGVLTFDYDRDGDLDILVVNHARTPILYRNDGGNGQSWLRIRTVGTLSNRDGIGAFINVTPDLSSPESFMVHEVSGSSNFLSQNEMTAHFGLGDHEGTVDSIEIRWPSGVVQQLVDQPMNTLPYITVTEPQATFDEWKNGVFSPLEVADAGVSGLEADPDGDSLTNLEEFAFNLRPKRIDSRDAVSIVIEDGLSREDYIIPGDHIILTYTRRISPVELNYVVEVAKDLTDWSSGPLKTEEWSVVDDGNGITETVRVRVLRPVAVDNPNFNPNFVRVRVSVP